MKNVVAAFIGLIISTLSAAQSVALPQCAAPERSVIELLGGTSEQMDRFVARLDSVVLFGTGRVNVLHIGGSHVQADIYTHVIRQRLDSLNGSLRPPRGFIFPYNIAKTNNPWNYRVTYGGEWTGHRNALRQFYPELGVGGVAAYTSDTLAWFAVELNTDTLHRWQASRIHLLGEALHGSAVPHLIIADTIDIQPQTEENGFFFDIGEEVDRFRISLRFDTLAAIVPDTFVVRGLIVDNDEAGLIYNSIGVNGASVPSYLGCSRFAQELAMLKPDLVVFAIGINDATLPDFSDSLFIANYEQLICQIRSVAPQCALCFITNNDSYTRTGRRRYKVNPNGLVAQQSFRAMARKHKAALWDLFDLMGGLESMAEWQNQNLSRPDKVHFSADGYRIVGQLFADAFLEFYLSYDYTANVF